MKLKDEVTKLVAEAIKLTEFCRDWRNRRIAHRDLKLALEQSTTQSRAQVKKALKAVAGILNAVEKQYCGLTTDHDLDGAAASSSLRGRAQLMEGLVMRVAVDSAKPDGTLLAISELASGAVVLFSGAMFSV